MKHYELENTNCFNKSHFGPMSHSVTQPGGMTLNNRIYNSQPLYIGSMCGCLRLICILCSSSWDFR